MVLSLEMQQEAFSKAFIQAVCAVAGLPSSRPEPDVNSVDWSVSGRVGGRFSQIDMQLKCFRDGVVDISKNDFPYVLDNLKNYDDITEADRSFPIILVVVRVPPTIEHWLGMEHERLVLAHCAYWVSLRGMSATQNKKSVSVRIPITQRFTPDELKRMMLAVSRRDYAMFNCQVPR